MKRLILLAVGLAVFCGSSLPVFSQEITPRPIAKDEWGIYDYNNNLIGSFKKTEKSNFKFYDSTGRYIGLILESRDLLPREANTSYTRVSPEEARLYLDTLEAIKKIGKTPSSGTGMY